MAAAGVRTCRADQCDPDRRRRDPGWRLRLLARGQAGPAACPGRGRAGRARRGPGRAQCDLTRALRAALGQPGFRTDLVSRTGGDELLAELEAAAHQVFLARKFYNDAVAATRSARRKWLVRLLRLAGGAPMPEFFEIDDSLVAGNGAGLATDMPHLTAGDPPAA